MKPLTIKDIARLSGTSPSTVSRVLTGVVPVADDKRSAILNTIAELNYRPNLLARSLKTKATHSLGLLINDVLNPFYGALARGVEDVARQEGYVVILGNTNEDPDTELAYLKMLQDKAVEGIVFAPSGANCAVVRELMDSGIAVVQVDRRIEGLGASSVTLDNRGGGYIATRHLAAHGHRRIGFVTYAMGQMTVALRERGYRDALDEANIGLEQGDACRVSFDLADVPACLEKMLQAPEPPTALIAANNRIALAVMRALKQLEKAIPDDIALVVFDDLEIFDLMIPALTAVAQPSYEIGRQAAEFLFAQIREEEPHEPRSKVFAPELIVRSSSAAPRR
ncbi:MAG: LacI family DNA-binding transcriptional regulator [Capsulimonadaceae bacterium]|nr:LacI family DNA-binding transcriptional regulator [Capsulimonadaceae bacterium]